MGKKLSQKLKFWESLEGAEKRNGNVHQKAAAVSLSA
jgi:hypothetical protein